MVGQTRLSAAWRVKKKVSRVLNDRMASAKPMSRS